MLKTLGKLIISLFVEWNKVSNSINSMKLSFLKVSVILKFGSFLFVIYCIMTHQIHTLKQRLYSFLILTQIQNWIVQNFWKCNSIAKKKIGIRKNSFWDQKLVHSFCCCCSIPTSTKEDKILWGGGCKITTKLTQSCIVNVSHCRNQHWKNEMFTVQSIQNQTF
jgi:hypothetical protein